MSISSCTPQNLAINSYNGGEQESLKKHAKCNTEGDRGTGVTCLMYKQTVSDPKMHEVFEIAFQISCVHLTLSVLEKTLKIVHVLSVEPDATAQQSQEWAQQQSLSST